MFSKFFYRSVLRENRTIRMCFFLFLIFLSNTNPHFSQNEGFQWQVGEELIFKVKWSVFRLGTLRLHVINSTIVDSTEIFHMKFFIDSNPLLFFVNMHSVFESDIDTHFHLRQYLANEKIEGKRYITEYRLDYADSLIHIKWTDIKDTSNIIIKTEPLNDVLLDGLGMIFYARAHLFSQRRDTITTFFEGKRGDATFEFSNKNCQIKIGALDMPVEARQVQGNILLKTTAGLSGPYKGWFSTDNRRIPLKAQLKVFIGYVTLELEKWTYWKPLNGGS